MLERFFGSKDDDEIDEDASFEKLLIKADPQVLQEMDDLYVRLGYITDDQRIMKKYRALTEGLQEPGCES